MVSHSVNILADLSIEAIFVNPTQASRFEYGFSIRDEIDIMVDDLPSWRVVGWTPKVDKDGSIIVTRVPIKGGWLDGPFNTDRGGENHLRLTTLDDEGCLFVNDEFVSCFDISGYKITDEVRVASKYADVYYEGVVVRPILAPGATTVPTPTSSPTPTPRPAPINLTNNPFEDKYPICWSPDGRHIAFVSLRDANYEIYTMKPDGSGITRLTDNRTADLKPIWSPDGRRIAFESGAGISVINADGSGLNDLSSDSIYVQFPSWSPDGQRIASSANMDIYVMNVDGSNLIRLTDSLWEDNYPSWSPDGQRVAFVSNRDGNWEIYVVNVDGSGLARLTDDVGYVYSFNQGGRQTDSVSLL